MTPTKPSIWGIWSIVGTVVLLSALPPARAALRSDELQLADGSATPCVAIAPVDVSGLSAPPAGEGRYRPTHSSVESVMVAVERSLIVHRSRIGGLYGP